MLYNSLVMKKKLLFIIVLIIIIGTVLGIFLNKTVILDKIKTEVLKTVESKLGRNVNFDKVDYQILKGFVITNLKISEQSPDTPQSFLTAKEISFNPIVFPFIFKKNIMIPSININSLNAHVARLDEKTWNFSDIIESLTSGEKTESKFSVTVLKIQANDSEILFEDKSLPEKFSKRLKNLNISISPSIPKYIGFDFSSDIENQDTPTKILLSGKFDLINKSLDSSLKIDDLLIPDYLVYLKNLPIAINQGSLSTVSELNYGNDKLNASGTCSIKNLDIDKNDIGLIGDLSSNYKFNYQIKNPENPFDYEAKIQLSNAKVSGLEYLNEIDNISGDFDIALDKLNCKTLSAQLMGEPIQISGKLENFKDPNINLNVISKISLAKLKDIFKEKINLGNIKLDGESNLQLTISGAVSKPESLELKGNAKISKVIFGADYLPYEITDIEGEINFDRNSISWKNLIANYKQEELISNGSVTNFTSPQATLTLSSDLINLEGEFDVKEKIIQINKLKGNYFESKFDVSGNIDILNAKNPYLNLSANATIDLKTMGDFNPEIKSKIGNLKLSGLLITQAKLEGRLKDQRNLQFKVNSIADSISIFGLEIKDVTLNYIKELSPIAIMQLSGNPYSGKILFNGKMDFSDRNLPFICDLIINDVDIAELKNDTNLKNKNISGTLQAQTSLQGSAKDIKNSLNGDGKIKLEDGNLWQMELFKGIGELLVIPQFQKIVFKEAYGDFLIANNKITTDNFMLESDPVNILFEGNLDFSGNINFDVTTQLAEGLIKDATDFKGILNTILAQSTNAVTVKLTGTFQKPQYKIIPIPAKIIKKAKDFVIEDIFVDILK